MLNRETWHFQTIHVELSYDNFPGSSVAAVELKRGISGRIGGALPPPGCESVDINILLDQAKEQDDANEQYTGA